MPHYDWDLLSLSEALRFVGDLLRRAVVTDDHMWAQRIHNVHGLRAPPAYCIVILPQGGAKHEVPRYKLATTFQRV